MLGLTLLNKIFIDLTFLFYYVPSTITTTNSAHEVHLISTLSAIVTVSYTQSIDELVT